MKSGVMIIRLPMCAGPRPQHRSLSRSRGRETHQCRTLDFASVPVRMRSEPINDCRRSRGALLGVLSVYDTQSEAKRRIEITERATRSKIREVGPARFIGAGDYVRTMFASHFKVAGADFRAVATASGVSAHDVERSLVHPRTVQCRRNYE